MSDDVLLRLVIDAKGAVVGVKQADGSVRKLDTTLKKSEKNVSRWGRVFDFALGSLAANAVQGLTQSLGRLVRNGIGLLDSSMKAAGIQQIAERKLEQALRNVGEASPAVAARLKAVAAEVQKVSNFGDESIITAQAMLLSFREVGGARGAEMLTSRLADVAAGVAKTSGQTMDLNSVAALMGRAMTTGSSALTRVGVSLTDAQKAAFDAAGGLDKVAMLGEILDSNFKGLAAATVDPLVQLQNVAGDVAEVFGAELLPIAQDVAKRLIEVGQSEEAMDAVRSAATGLASAILSTANALGAAIRFTREHSTAIRTTGEIVVATTVAVVAYSAAMKAAALWTRRMGLAAMWAAVKVRILNVVTAMNPIGLLIAALAAVGVLLWRFRDRVADATASVLDFTSRVTRSVGKLVEKVAGFINALPDALPGVSALKTGVAGLSRFVELNARAMDVGAEKLRGYATATAEAAEEAESLTAGAVDATSSIDELRAALAALAKTEEKLTDEGAMTEEIQAQIDARRAVILGLIKQKDETEDLTTATGDVRDVLAEASKQVREMEADLKAMTGADRDAILVMELRRQELARLIDAQKAWLDTAGQRPKGSGDLRDLPGTGMGGRDTVGTVGAGDLATTPDLASPALEAASAWDQLAASIRANGEQIQAYGAQAQQVLGGLGQLARARSDARLSEIEQEERAALASIDRRLEAENLSVAERERLLEQRARAEAAFQKKKAAEQRKAALFEKRLTLVQIAIETARNVVQAFPNVAAMAFAGVLGGIQAAAVDAQPIPAYARGGRNVPGGLALVGEQGPELVNLPGGSDVITASETRRILASVGGGNAGIAGALASSRPAQPGAIAAEVARAVAAAPRDRMIGGSLTMDSRKLAVTLEEVTAEINSTQQF